MTGKSDGMEKNEHGSSGSSKKGNVWVPRKPKVVTT